MKLGKVHAGAMQLTLFIIVVIGLMLSSFIMLLSIQNRFKAQSKLFTETIDLVNEGIEYSFKNQLETGVPTTIDLQDQNYKALEVVKDFWGVFEKVSATARIKTFEYEKIALIGGLNFNNNVDALWLMDNNKPLVVVGNAKIEGNVFLPSKGVRAGNISGQSYYGKDLIYGNASTIDTFPKINEELINSLTLLLDNIQELETSNIIELSENLTNSFSNEVKIIYSYDDIILEDIELTGHIIVKSDQKIIVDSTAKLNDIILIAPEIAISDKVKGVFQSVARSSITVGKHCSLDYPSSLVVIKEDKETEVLNQAGKEILIREGSTVKGVVVYQGLLKKNNYSPQVVVERGVNIYGEIYCNTKLELLGTVNGSVITSDFVVRHSGSIYQNHLFDGNILSSQLNSNYVGLLKAKSDKGVAKWMY